MEFYSNSIDYVNQTSQSKAVNVINQLEMVK